MKKECELQSIIKFTSFIIMTSLIGMLSPYLGTVNYIIIILLAYGITYIMLNKKYKINILHLYCILFFILKPYVNAIIITMLFVIFMFRRKFNLTEEIIILFGILTFNLLSINNAISKSRVYTEIIAWIINIVVFIMAYNYFDIKEYKKIFKTIIQSGILASFIIIIKCTNIEIYNFINSISIVHVPDNNYLSTYLLLILPIVIFMIDYNDKNKIMYAFIGILYTFALIIIQSRGTIALSILLIVLYILKKNTNKPALFIAILAVVITIGLKYMNPVAERLFSNSNYSNYIRGRITSDTVNYMIPKNIISGVGAGNFANAYNEYSTISFNAAHAHNIFLNVAAELGLGGLVLVILLLKSFATKCISSILKSNVERDRLCKLKFIMYLSILSTFIIYSFVENTWGDSRVSILFFLIMGSMCKLYRIYNNKERDYIEYECIDDKNRL